VADTQLAYVKERRSTRIDRSIPLMIHGADLSRLPYQEQVSTLTISYHGCKYRTRHQVVRGDVVVLEVNHPNEGSSRTSSRARVKWLHALTNGHDGTFEVAVELEAPGNVWGVPSPPQDWFAAAHADRETRRNGDANFESQPDLTSAPSGLNQSLQLVTQPRQHAASLGQVMVGLGEQIQAMASEAATTVMFGEKDRLLGEFRVQLQKEAVRTLESVIAASKDELVLRVSKELSEAHDAAAQAIYERWLGKIEKDTENANVRIATHGAEVSLRVENMAVGTIERLQHSMDASRREAVDQCLTRLRSQLVPLLEEVESARERLAACEDDLKVKSLVICKQFEDFMVLEAERSACTTQETVQISMKQFDDDVTQRLAAVRDALDTKSTATIEESARVLRDLSQNCERTVQTQFETLVKSATDQASLELKERTEQISQQCAAELEGCTRSHLDFISESIAEIATKRVVCPRD
jgi:hypothetical protein